MPPPRPTWASSSESAATNRRFQIEVPISPGDLVFGLQPVIQCVTVYPPPLQEQVIRTEPYLVFEHGFNRLVMHDNGILHGSTSTRFIVRQARASQYPDFTATSG